MRKLIPTFLSFIILLAACSGNQPTPTQEAAVAADAIANADPLATYMPPTKVPGAADSTPTPDLSDQPYFFPTYTPLAVQAAVGESTPTSEANTYTVEDNDIWGTIADKLGVSVDDLLAANNASEYDIIFPGDILQVPPKTSNGQNNGQSAIAGTVSDSPEYFKIVPDSEMVYGPLTARFDVAKFVESKGGYLNSYTQDVSDRTLTGAQIVDEVARDYSVSPRLLLAILEYRSGWVTKPEPDSQNADTMIAYFDDYHVGLYRQLMFTASLLNEGFYGWRTKQLTQLNLQDGAVFGPAFGTNAGTVGIQNFFAFIDESDTWKQDIGPTGLYTTFGTLFGDPFNYRVEPLLPPAYQQPALSLPFKAGEQWHFTGGPHSGWDNGSAWAAIDFAPPGEPLGCQTSDYWATAVASGVIARSDNGAVILDLDGDGYEQTGWTVLYLHMAADGRVEVGKTVKEGDRIGHPSCEGGESMASHLHIARRLNGVWIPAADPTAPMNFGGYQLIADGQEYNGWLVQGDKKIEAQDGYLDGNIVTH